MFEILDTLIEYILQVYSDLHQKWKDTDEFIGINLKKKQVFDIQNDEDLWNMIKEYRKFMMMAQICILKGLSAFRTKQSRVSIRIKQLNSIEYKMHRYISGSLEGKVPINKCFNDLIGVRVIIDGEFSHEDIEKHIHERFPGLKLTNSSKNGYVESHVYFMNGNHLFPWELQIWKSADETNNLKSHKLYKQGYTAWEKKYKNV